MSDTIDIMCRKCPRKETVPRQDYDYPEATVMKLNCPDCWDGDFDEPDYFDADGKPVQYDPDLIASQKQPKARSKTR